jgi:hypothetical protein
LKFVVFLEVDQIEGLVLIFIKPERLIENRGWVILNLFFGHSDCCTERFPLSFVSSHFCRGELPSKPFIAFHAAVAIVAKDDKIYRIVIGWVTVCVMDDNVFSLCSTKAAGVPVGHHQGKCNSFRYRRAATHSQTIVPLRLKPLPINDFDSLENFSLDNASDSSWKVLRATPLEGVADDAKRLRCGEAFPTSDVIR